MKFTFLLSLLIGLHISAFSQTFTMTDNLHSIDSTCSGTITDGVGNYNDNVESEITICSSTPGQGIILDFTTFQIEEDFDYLTIHDGTSTSNPLLGVFTGSTLPPSFASSGECITLIFESDGSVNQDGFTINISCFALPTCADGIQNQGETAVDCGGCFCPSCNSLPLTIIDSSSALFTIINIDTLACNNLNITLETNYITNYLLFEENFNNALDTNKWDTSFANMVFSNPCLNGPDSTYLWFDDSFASPREVRTLPLNLAQADTLCFFIRMPVQTGTGPSSCEGPDEYDEGVLLQFSNSSCVNSWVDIVYMTPNGEFLEYFPFGQNSPGANGPTIFSNWNEYCFALPLGAKTEDTQIRWRQMGSSGTGYDHWGLDEIRIFSSDTISNNIGYYYDWEHIPGSPDTNNLSFNTTVADTFIVHYTNGINDTLTDSVFINMESTSLEYTITTIQPVCNANQIGNIQIIPTGSTLINLEVSDINGLIYSNFHVANDTIYLDSLPLGDYQIVLTDETWCATSIDTTVTILDSEVIIPSVVSTDANCPPGFNDDCSGTISTTHNGPVSTSFLVNILDSNDTFVSSFPNFLSACKGNYLVITTHGVCTDTLETIVNGPDSLFIEYVVHQPNCLGDNGSLEINYVGGTSPYTVNITPNNNILNLPPNNYNFWIQDANLCTVLPVNNFDIFASTNEVTTSYITSDEIYGNDGSIDLQIISGTPPFTYDWDNDGINDWDDTEDLINLPSGTYIVFVKDSNGCQTSDTIFVDSQLSLDEWEAYEIKVYPNPTSSKFKIDSPVQVNYILVDSKGALIKKGIIHQTETIDLSGRAKGSYFLELKFNTEKSIYRKIIKQ